MPADHTMVAHTEGMRGLNIFELAQLERFATQQAAQAGPAGDAKNDTKEQQSQIGTLRGGWKQLGMRVDIDLHHEHGGGDQQDAGN